VLEPTDMSKYDLAASDLLAAVACGIARLMTVGRHPGWIQTSGIGMTVISDDARADARFAARACGD
jgi:hypothetical protein